MALSKRENNLLWITITIVVVGVNYFLISQLVGPWRRKQQTLETDRRKLTEMQATIARQPEWQQRYNALGHDITQASRFENGSDVLKKIEDLKVSSGILMQSMRSGRVEERDVYREWPVTCNFEATTDSLVKFLHGLQSGAGFMTVEEINLTAKADNPSALRCDNVQIRALAKTEKAAP